MNPSTDQHWSAVYKQGRDFQLISSQEIDRFLEYVTPETPKTCLDLGSGTGQLSRELYHRGYEVVGIDASHEAVRRAQQLTIVSSEQLLYLHADIERINLKDMALPQAGFGVVTCKLVYAFIQDKPAFLEKVKSVLHPKGICVVITPMFEDVEVEKRPVATSDEDMKLLEAHFEKVAVYKSKGLTYFIGRQKVAKELRQ
jgi:2-polyprenyl-3-methyl-5-hydroxy-6-metoxy-1,4-benzoquinol methylase